MTATDTTTAPGTVTLTLDAATAANLRRVLRTVEVSRLSPGEQVALDVLDAAVPLTPTYYDTNGDRIDTAASYALILDSTVHAIVPGTSIAPRLAASADPAALSFAPLR